MSVRTDVINLNVNINGNQSQNQLNLLRKSASDLQFELKGLKKGTQEYIDKSNELKKVNADLVELKKTIGLTALNQKELTKELNTLKALRGSVVPFSKEYNELGESIKKVENRLYDVKNGVTGFASTFSKVSTELKQFGAAALGFLGIQFLTNSFQNVIQGAGKLSDQLADLRRVSGLTAAEANNLNDALVKIDSRTSTSGLREIAITAGKLGVAKEDLLDFTVAVDKLVVSLGDELGNADQITSQLGKILNVFDGKITGDNITKLGNAFVELANTGSATGAFIADFDQRLSGLAKSSGISLGALSGLGAGLEELGGRVESSSTAVQKILITIAQDLPKAAAIAGKDVAEFTKTFATAPEEALLQFSQGLTKDKASFADLTAGFKDAGEEGARVIETLIKMGTSTDYLRGRIDLGKQSNEEATAINAAFALKNETLGATLDKLGKEFSKLVQSSAVTDFLKGAIENVLKFIKFLGDLPKFFKDNIIAITLFTAAIVIQNAARIKNIALIALEKSGLKDLILNISTVTIAQKAAAIATAAWGVVTNLLTLNFKKAAAEFKALSLLIGINPFAILLVAVGAAVIAFKALADASSKASTAERVRQQIFTKANEAIAEQSAKIQMLSAVIKDNSISLETRQNALKELIALNPEYLKGLTLENFTTAQGTKILENYNLQLQNKARLEAAQTVLAEKAKADVDLALKQQELERKAVGADQSLGSGGNKIRSDRDEILLEVSDIKKQRAVIKGEMDEIIKLSVGLQKSNDQLNTKVQAVANTDKNIVSKNLQRTIEQIKADIKATEEAIEKAGVGTKLLKDLLAKKAALEKELNDALGIVTKEKKSKNQSDIDELVKQAEAFYKRIKELKAKAFAKDPSSPEQSELNEVQRQYEQLLAEAKTFLTKKAVSQQRFNEEQRLLEETLQKQIADIKKKYSDKDFEERSKASYDAALKSNSLAFEQQRKLAAQNYSKGLIDRIDYDDRLTQIDEQEATSRILIASTYSGTVKKAAEDVTTFVTAEENKQTNNLVKETDKRIELAKKNAAARLEAAVVNAQGPAQRKTALLAQLDAEYAINIKAAKRLNEDTVLIEANYHKRRKDIQDQFLQETLDNIANGIQTFQQYVMPLLDAFNDLQAAKDAATLQREKKLNDERVSLFKKQLDAKLISQSVYDKKTAAANEAYAAKERQLKREQAVRDKAAKKFQAIIGAALAIVQAFAQLGPIAGAIAAALIGVTTGLQIAAIENTPLPELGRGGKLRNGPKHRDADRGLQVVNPRTGRIEALVERDEAIMSSRSMNDRSQYSVTGTPSQIASTLNGINGGTTWDGPARVIPINRKAGWQTAPLPAIKSSMPKIMADGGKVAVSNNTAINEDTNDLLKQLIMEQKATREEMTNWERDLKAYVVLKEIHAAEDTLSQVKAASGF